MKVTITQPNISIKAGTQMVNVGTTDYNVLDNKPLINNVELADNKTLDDLNIQVKGNYPDEALTNGEIEELLNNFV